MNAGKSGFHYGLVGFGMVITFAASSLHLVLLGSDFLGHANLVCFGWCCWQLGGLKRR